MAQRSPEESGEESGRKQNTKEERGRRASESPGMMWEDVQGASLWEAPIKEVRGEGKEESELLSRCIIIPNSRGDILGFSLQGLWGPLPLFFFYGRLYIYVVAFTAFFMVENGFSFSANVSIRAA